MTTRLRLRATIALVVFLFVPVFNIFAEDPPDICKGADGNPQFCNGISVGAPKVFDNRTLTIMLESLSQTLQQQQTNYIDQKSVAAAFANIQGFSQTDTTTNTSITTTPTPATDVKTTLNTGNVSSTGTPLPNTFQRTTDVNRAAITPTAPTLDTTPAFQGFTPTYGSSPSDLLSDQVNLTYQIFNLRMILERALSDRVNPDGKPRRQAVLGFNVTVDPPRTANDAVAVVEITLCTLADSKCKQKCEAKWQKCGENSAGDPPMPALSLVALMPQEKTYNAAALSTKSNSFGGSAVVSSFQVGFSARKRGQIFYLYRDNDTISYERMTDTPGEIVFGWMFRPVLGRRAVSPGIRQLFAIAALPDDDCRGPFCPSPCLGPQADACKQSNAKNLVTSVRTYWKKYDRGTLTSFERQHTNRAKEFWYGLSFSLAKPQIFDGREYENVALYPPFEVKRSSEYENDLRPVVRSVTWRPMGAKSVVISAQGDNFFSQTSVALGDKTFTDGSGLILKPNQSFDLVTTTDALINGPGTVLGRYGNGAALISPANPRVRCPDVDANVSQDANGAAEIRRAEIQCLKNGVEVAQAYMSPAIAGLRQINIWLRGRPYDQDLTRESDAYRLRSEATALYQSLDEALKELSATSQRLSPVEQDASKRSSLAAKLRAIAPRTATPLGQIFGNALQPTQQAITDAASQLAPLPGQRNPSQREINRAVVNAQASIDQARALAAAAKITAEQQAETAQRAVEEAHPLTVSRLPVTPAFTGTLTTIETPIVSVNGTPLDLPYEFVDVNNGRNVDQVLIRAYVKDSLVSDSGGGIVKVSWPFYSQNKWTATYRFYNPDLAFALTRVSANTVVISRVNGLGFVEDFELSALDPCWKLIVGDTETKLATSRCSPPPPPSAPKNCPNKTKPCDPPPPPPIGPISDFTVSLTASAPLPDNVVLVAPIGSTYNLAVPPVKAKDDKASPIELNQFDSEWVQVKASELTPGPGTAGAKSAKPPDDFSTLASVTANGKPVERRRQSIDQKVNNPKTGKPYPPTVVEVEITRSLTSIPGTIQLGFFGGDSGTELLGTRQINVTPTQWETEGDK